MAYRDEYIDGVLKALDNVEGERDPGLSVRGMLKEIQRLRALCQEYEPAYKAAYAFRAAIREGTIHEMAAQALLRSISQPGYFAPRGIGMDVTPGCFVCGGEKRLLHNIAGFIDGKDAGADLLQLFSQGARVDFRPSEPNWIQLKIGACDEHMPNLQLLYTLSAPARRLTQEMVDQALALVPENQENRE